MLKIAVIIIGLFAQAYTFMYLDKKYSVDQLGRRVLGAIGATAVIYAVVFCISEFIL